MRALIVDDEELARRNLINVLTGAVEIVGEAADGVTALEKIGELSPDVVFLDIEMPGMNGIEVAAHLSEPPRVVFVTAYDHYAIQAFEAHAADYLLKPLRRERVAATLERLRSEHAKPDRLRETLREFPTLIKITGTSWEQGCAAGACRCDLDWGRGPTRVLAYR